MTKKLLMLAVAFAAAIPLMAATETVGSYTWTYRINSDTAEIQRGISPKPKGVLAIPSTLGGNPVTSIGEWSFHNCSRLKGVTIPNSVTSIKDWAFFDCRNLVSVTIPSSVTHIDGQVFCGCSGLLSFVVAAENPKYRSVSGSLLTKDGTTLVYGVNGDVLIPNSVTNISNESFWGFSGLTSVTIPNSVTSIGIRAFSYCSGLTSFVVADGNPSYKSMCGLLLTKDRKTLVHGVNGDVIILDGIKSIGDYAFDGCSGLTSVTIPNSVTSIGDWAFSDCSGLTSVTIPNSVTSIGDSAFRCCSGLTSVTLPNRFKEERRNIFDGCPKTMTITYSDE